MIDQLINERHGAVATTKSVFTSSNNVIGGGFSKHGNSTRVSEIMSRDPQELS